MSHFSVCSLGKLMHRVPACLGEGHVSASEELCRKEDTELQWNRGVCGQCPQNRASRGDACAERQHCLVRPDVGS